MLTETQLFRWPNNDALMDVTVATAQYESALLWCTNALMQRHSGDIFSDFDHITFHCNAPYHARRNLRLLVEAMNGKQSTDRHESLYQQYVAPGTKISGLNGTTYTASLYACLISLLVTRSDALIGQRLLCFSYGSGCASSMYSLRVQSLPHYPASTLEQLQSRMVKTVNETLQLTQLFESAHGLFGWDPTHQQPIARNGIYYLKSVSEFGIRQYEQHDVPSGISVGEIGANALLLDLPEKMLEANPVAGFLSHDISELRTILFADSCKYLAGIRHWECLAQMFQMLNTPLAILVLSGTHG